MKRTSRTPCTLPDSLHHRLNAYALAASAAGVSLLALADPAQAKIVYTPGHVTFGGSPVVYRGNRGSYYLDLNHDGFPDFVFSWNEYIDARPRRLTLNDRPAYSAFATLSVHPIGNNGVAGKPYRSSCSFGCNRAFCLGSGASIGPQQPFAGGMMASIRLSVGFSSGSWLYPGGGEGNVTGYLGLKFAIHGQTHYGWARLN